MGSAEVDGAAQGAGGAAQWAGGRHRNGAEQTPSDAQGIACGLLRAFKPQTPWQWCATEEGHARARVALDTSCDGAQTVIIAAEAAYSGMLRPSPT